MSPSLWTDQPISTVAEDFFGRQAYAEALGQVALTGNTPLTIGIFGPRGAGKTSLMRLIWLYIAEQRGANLRRPYGTWFDARRDQSERAPWQRLLGQVLNELREAELTPTESHTLAQWAALMDPAMPPKLRAPESLPGHALPPELGDLPGELSRLIYARVWERQAVLSIFIDELDDCPPEHVRQICDTVSRFLTTPGCIVFLAADATYLRDILDSRDGTPSGKLEKLVQLPFTLPAFQSVQIEHYLTQIAPEIPGEARDIFGNGLPPNPRRIKRALNLFWLLTELASRHAPTGNIPSLDPVLLAKTVTLHEGYPQLYADLCEYPRLLLELEAHARGVRPEPGIAFLPGADKVATTLEQYAKVPPLTYILRQGTPFASRALPEIKRHLHLTPSAPPERSSAVALEQRLWEDMVSGDINLIRAAVETVRRLESHTLYINALVQLVQSRRPTPLGQRLSAAMALGYLGDPRDFSAVVDIPAGEFPYGEERLPYYLLAYRIRRYLVTNAEYAQFLQAHPEIPVPQTQDAWGRAYNWDAERRTYPHGKGNYPVVLVTWDEAAAYCAWVGGRLPTQEEWERAARGRDGRIYPWGNAFTTECANTRESGLGSSTPVGVFTDGASAEGLLDMAGNVWEWTASDYNLQTKVIRGGAWNFPAETAKVYTVERSRPDNRSPTIGFRVVFPAQPKPA